MSKTKMVGVLMVIVAVIKTAADAMNGGGFNPMDHLNEIDMALQGLGIFFLRHAMQKFQ